MKSKTKKLIISLTSLILAFSVTLSAVAVETHLGIDVSVFQGSINWGKVAKTDKEFAIIRIGYNDKQDAQFENNYNNAKANNIPVGAYMYSYAVTEEAAIEEANIVLDRIKGKKFEYPIYLDIEDSKIIDKSGKYNLTKEKRTKNALAFVKTMQENGYCVGIYANYNFFTNYLNLDDIQSKCETWIAHYNEKKDYSNTKFGMWQYSENGTVDGISGNVDLNICYKDYPAIIKSGGYNGYTKFIKASGVKGDVNGDGTCNLSDVVNLAQYVAKWFPISAVESELNADNDEKGNIDLNDVIYLAQYVAGWFG